MIRNLHHQGLMKFAPPQLYQLWRQLYSNPKCSCPLIYMRSKSYVFNGKSKRIDKDDLFCTASTHLCSVNYFPKLRINSTILVIGCLNWIIRTNNLSFPIHSPDQPP